MLVRKKQGNSLIEVMISMCIVVTTMMTTATVINSIHGSREKINYEIEDIYTLEAVKKIIICNYSYERIKERLKDRTIYLNNDSLNNLNQKSYDVFLHGENLASSYPYVSLKGKESEGGTMIINISYYDEKGNKLENVFYKGKYEEVQ